MSTHGKSAESLALIEAAKEILAEIAPCSVRAVAYQLFNRKLIPDMGKGSTKRVSEQLVWARENGEIDWDDITDETRTPEFNEGWDNGSNALARTIAGYRRDNWREQRHRLLVVSEKGTIAGTVRPVLEDYGINLLTMHGFGSATAINDLAVVSRNSDKPLTILYIGDFDPSGMQMSEVDLLDRLLDYGASPDIRLRRVALEESDLEALGDACFSVHDKTQDARYEWFLKNHGEVCAELDALSPAVLRKRLEQAIRGHLDRDAWEHSLAIEAAEVESMRLFHEQWKATLAS